jgi:hypothetical protein
MQQQGARPSIEPQKSNLWQSGAYTIATPHKCTYILNNESEEQISRNIFFYLFRFFCIALSKCQKIFGRKIEQQVIGAVHTVL